MQSVTYINCKNETITITANEIVEFYNSYILREETVDGLMRTVVPSDEIQRVITPIHTA